MEIIRRHRGERNVDALIPMFGFDRGVYLVVAKAHRIEKKATRVFFIVSSLQMSSGSDETSSWGRGTGRRGPSRGVTERRIESGHKWNMTYRWDRTPQTNKEMLQHMTAMQKGYRGMLKSKHYKGKTFEDVIKSIPPGVDLSDWWTMVSTLEVTFLLPKSISSLR
ncbi:hypothetical protein Taro_043570 [Colocasia esculenta]|uniref:Uncharacterized protein n=1 Tax=Colocasia esculenta TaxID=4460 RepID=A0A843WJR9_COLES|nr:hypothetical protein [Colocasia esculenta]